MTPYALATAWLFATPTSLMAVSLSITDAISETVGTTAVIPDSGSADNTTNWETSSTVGIFEMNGGDFYMRVSATNPTGGLASQNDSLMVVRTVDSQGLTDTGTLSVYVRPDPLEDTPWSLDLNFSFFSDQALTVPAPLTLLLTSLDIDYDQQYFVSNASFFTNITSDNSDITTPGTVPTGYSGFTATDDSVVNNPAHAVASVGQGDSFDIRIAHNAVALFMFEFRDPSSVVGLIPEPSTSLLAMAGLAMFGLRRRRPHLA